MPTSPSSAASSASEPAIAWVPLSTVKSAAFVGTLDSRPFALIEHSTNHEFDAITVVGEYVGRYTSIDEAKSALERWLTPRLVEPLSA